MSIVRIPDRKEAVASGTWKGFGKSRLSVVSFPSENDTKPIEIDEPKEKVADIESLHPCSPMKVLSLKCKF